jgi:hypothetical protein
MAGSHNQRKKGRSFVPSVPSGPGGITGMRKEMGVIGRFSHYNAGALGIPMILKGGVGDRTVCILSSGIQNAVLL